MVERRKRKSELISEEEKQRRAAQLRHSLANPTPHPLGLNRTRRLAQILDVSRCTIWRWRREGVLPPFTKVGGVEGLTNEQLAEVMKARSGGGA